VGRSFSWALAVPSKFVTYWFDQWTTTRETPTFFTTSARAKSTSGLGSSSWTETITLAFCYEFNERSQTFRTPTLATGGHYGGKGYKD